MATTVFTGAQIASFLYGRIDSLTNTARVVHRVPGSGFHGYITGTDASFLMAAGGTTPFSVSVDGGAYSTPTLAAGSLPIFAGLSDTAHLVDVRLGAAYGGTGVYLTASGALSVTGSTPAVAGDPDYGPQVLALAGRDVVSTVLPDISSTSAVLGPPLGSSTYASVPPAGAGTGLSALTVRVRGRADKVWVNTTTNSRWFALEKDGVRVGSVLTSGLTTYQWVLVGSGLDDGDEHEWGVVCGGNGGGGQILDGVMLGGSVAALSTSPPTRRATVMTFGDSLTVGVTGGGSDATAGDATLAYGSVLARLLGRDAIIQGRPGSTSLVGSQQVATDLAMAARTGAPPAHLAILYGRNDSVYADVLANYTAMLQSALACPSFDGKIVAITVPEIGAYASTGATINPAIRDAVTAVGSDRVTLVEGAAWTDIATGTDGTHYSVTGHATLAQRLYDSGAFAETPSGTGATAEEIVEALYDSILVNTTTFREAVRTIAAKAAGDLTENASHTTTSIADINDPETVRITSVNTATTRTVTVH